MVETAALLKKLQIKPGARLRLVNVPPELVAALQAGEVTLAKAGEPCTAFIGFCESPADVTRLTAEALKSLPADGLLWFAYRKGKAAELSGLSRDNGWAALAEKNWRPVRSIAFDETWTGLRFKPVDLVKSETPEAWRSRGKSEG